MTRSLKPRRPFGLTLAILSSVLIYSVVPLFVTMVLFYLNGYFERSADGGMSGMAVTGFNPIPLVLVMIVAIAFIFVAIFTWIGRPAMMRYVFPAFVTLMSVFIVVTNVLPALTAQPSVATGIDSSANLSKQLLSSYSVMVLIITVYSIWFSNRWSARAFFRGYYTSKDMETMQQLDISPSPDLTVTN